MSTLFSKTSLFEKLEGIKKSVPKSISNISSEDIIEKGEDELVARVLEDIKPCPPLLKLEPNQETVQARPCFHISSK